MFLTDLLVLDLVFHPSHVPPRTGIIGAGSYLTEGINHNLNTNLAKPDYVSSCQRDGGGRGMEGWDDKG